MINKGFGYSDIYKYRKEQRMLIRILGGLLTLALLFVVCSIVCI